MGAASGPGKCLDCGREGEEERGKGKKEEANV